MNTMLVCTLFFIQLFEGKRNSHFTYHSQTLGKLGNHYCMFTFFFFSSSVCRVDPQAADREPVTGALLFPSAGARQPDGPPPLPPQTPEPDHPAVNGWGRRAQGRPGAQGASAAPWRPVLPAGQCDHIKSTARRHGTLHVGAELPRGEQLRPDHPQCSKGVLVGWRDRSVVHTSHNSASTQLNPSSSVKVFNVDWCVCGAGRSCQCSPSYPPLLLTICTAAGLLLLTLSWLAVEKCVSNCTLQLILHSAETPSSTCHFWDLLWWGNDAVKCF